MKNSILSIVCFLAISLMLSCQGVNDEQATLLPKRDPKAGARRACNNTVNYGFLKPDDDYGYNGTGCQSFYIHRGSTRQIKIKMANTSGFSQSISIRYEHPDNPGNIQYSVASVTGGSTSSGSPVPGSFYGAYILWTATVPAFTTYEMTLNVYGVTGSAAAENGVRLMLLEPCAPDNTDDCDQDDNMHFVLAD